MELNRVNTPGFSFGKLLRRIREAEVDQELRHAHSFIPNILISIRKGAEAPFLRNAMAAGTIDNVDPQAAAAAAAHKTRWLAGDRISPWAHPCSISSQDDSVSPYPSLSRYSRDR